MFQRHAAPPGERMARPGADDQRIPPPRLRLQIAGIDRRADEADVERHVAHPLQHLVRGQDAHFDPHAGVAAHEGRAQARQHIIAHRRGRPDAQPPAHLLRQRQRLQIGDLHQYAARHFQHRPPAIGEQNAAAGPGEQPHAQMRFQILERHARRRGAEPDLLRRARDAADAGHRLEHRELTQRDPHHSSSRAVRVAPGVPLIRSRPGASPRPAPSAPWRCRRRRASPKDRKSASHGCHWVR